MLTIVEAKHQCNIEQDFTEDDAWFDIRIKAAARYVENYTRRTLYADATDPAYLSDPDSLLYGPDIATAMCLLIGHWYENREAVNVGNITSTFDLAVESLLQPYRIYGL